MNRLLDEVKVLMHESGYSIEDIKKVVASFNNFISYVSRNGLEQELDGYIPAIKNNVLKRISGGKNSSNIASVAEFNGTSPASIFVKECVERRVQDVLKGFLRSSEIYYNMACNSEGVDASRIFAQLELDGINRDKSIELTAPTTIMAFSTELSLKTLYSVKNYDAIVRNIYADVTRLENGIYPNEGVLNNRVAMIEQVSGDWKSIAISGSAQQTMNDVRDSYIGDKPINIPEDDRFGNVKVNGHTLYKVFDNLPEEYRTMIKYQIATAFSRGDKKSLDDKVVSAIDYFLMVSTLDTTLDNMDPTKQMVINSNNFDRMRYLIDQLGSEELLFSMAYATSSYIVAKNEVEGRSFSRTKNCDYTSKGLQFTEALNELVSSNPAKKYLLDYIVNNKQLLGVAKTLCSKDLYVLIDMFSLDELNWMKDSCNVKDSCSFKEMMYYCVFFKRNLNDYEFRYTGEKYKNINKLFYTIKSTNNLAMIGSQIAQWCAEINIYSLSQEEFDALKIFDNEYIYNSLSYKDRVLYKKCSDRGVPFKIYYTSTAYTDVISKYMDSSEFSADGFDDQVGYQINRAFNRIILVNEDRVNNLKENIELHDILINEFGTISNIPNFLLSLPLDDIRVIVEYCRVNNQSLKEWSVELLTSPCFFCRSMFIINKIKSCYEFFRVRVAPGVNDSNLSRIQSLFINRERGINPIPFGTDTIIKENTTGAKIRDMNAYLRTVYQEVSMEFDLKYEKQTDEDLLNYLLSNGFDYLTASYLQRNTSRESIDKLLDYVRTKAVPKETLTLLGSGRLTISDFIMKNQFFVAHGCRLDDIPVYYYTVTNITLSTFEKLFDILNGIYSKTSIPLVLLTKETDKVSVLLNKLKNEKINVYDFISFMPLGGSKLFDMIDDYIGIYKQIKNVAIDSGMRVKNFDLVVSDYKEIKTFLNLQVDNILLLKTSLYKDFYAMKTIVEYCQSHNVPFMPEYFYFDMDFLKDNLNYIYVIVDAQRRMRQQMTYENALDLMSSMSYDAQKSRNEVVMK